MRVCSLKLTSFRNYAALDLEPGEGLNILHGSNAQGKSNILEALSLLATTRSLRAGRESELIRREAEMAHVLADVEREREGEAELQVSVFQTDKKAIRVNGLKRPRVVDLLGQFNAVFFGALDLAIVSGEPSDRRHYLNIEISQISPRYVYDLGHYKRTLEQRNRLLRDLRDHPVRYRAESGLDAWNEQLVQYGAPLFEKRRFYIERLAPIANAVHRDLTDGAESLEIRYMPSIALPNESIEHQALSVKNGNSTPDAQRSTLIQETAEARYLAEAGAQAADENDNRRSSATEPSPANGPQRPLNAPESVAQAFRDQLCRVADDEARRGTTLLGPQRDDLCFFINGADAKTYGSQGQQRTVALALKLAEFQLIEDYVGEPPVMLLDDVMSDLDDTRRKHLLHWLRRRCQTFLTCTNLRAFPDSILREAAIFRVVAGTVMREERREEGEKARQETRDERRETDEGEKAKKQEGKRSKISEILAGEGEKENAESAASRRSIEKQPVRESATRKPLGADAESASEPSGNEPDSIAESSFVSEQPASNAADRGNDESAPRTLSNAPPEHSATDT